MSEPTNNFDFCTRLALEHTIKLKMKNHELIERCRKLKKCCLKNWADLKTPNEIKTARDVYFHACLENVNYTS